MGLNIGSLLGAVSYLFFSSLPSLRSETGGWRGLRVTDGKVYQVDSNWGNAVYVAVYPKDNKRKGDTEIETENPSTKTKRLDSKQRCSGSEAVPTGPSG